MATASPENLVGVLSEVVTKALQSLADQPEQIADQLRDTWEELKRTSDELKQTGEDFKDIPPQVLQSLKDLVDPPDFKSLLIFVLMKVAELDPVHMSVVALRDAGEDADGVGMRYAVTDPLQASLTVGVFFSGPTKPKAFIIKADGAINKTIPENPAPDALQVRIVSDPGDAPGDLVWNIPLDHFERPQQAQATALTLSISKRFRPADITPPGGTIKVGPIAARLRLSTKQDEPLWSAQAAFGDFEQGATAVPGVGVTFQPDELLGKDLARNIAITLPQAECSPLASLEAGKPPVFDLRQKVS